METKEPIDALTRLPEDVQGIVLALSIVVKRIEALPPADREDLFKLMVARHDTHDSEEQDAIRAAMIEILTRGKVSATAMLPQDARPLSSASASWAKHVGRKIRTLREEAGLTQAKLAELAKLPQSHISRLENAEHTATHLTLKKIADALGVDVGSIDPCLD